MRNGKFCQEEDIFAETSRAQVQSRQELPQENNPIFTQKQDLQIQVILNGSGSDKSFGWIQILNLYQNSRIEKVLWSYKLIFHYSRLKQNFSKCSKYFVSVNKLSYNFYFSITFLVRSRIRIKMAGVYRTDSEKSRTDPDLSPAQQWPNLSNFHFKSGQVMHNTSFQNL